MDGLNLLDLGRAAHAERERRHGHRVYYTLGTAAAFDLLECGPDEIERAVKEYRGQARALAVAIKGEPGQTTGEADLRLVALARIHLPWVEHVVAHCERLTPYVAQVALRFGADQLAGFPPGLSKQEIERLIREASLEPFECDAEYQPHTSAETGLTVLYS